MSIKSLPLFILISSGLLNAQVVPGNWNKVYALSRGQKIVVTLKDGNSMRCTFYGAASNRLSVILENGRSLNISPSDVAEIEMYRESRNGSKAPWIGAAVGFGAGLGVAVGLCHARPCDEDDRAKGIAAVSLLGAGIGYLVGAFAFGGGGLDAVADLTPESVYRAPGY